MPLVDLVQPCWWRFLVTSAFGVVTTGISIWTGPGFLSEGEKTYARQKWQQIFHKR